MLVCEKCKLPVPSSARFCPGCGNKLEFTGQWPAAAQPSGEAVDYGIKSEPFFKKSDLKGFLIVGAVFLLIWLFVAGGNAIREAQERAAERRAAQALAERQRALTPEMVAAVQVGTPAELLTWAREHDLDYSGAGAVPRQTVDAFNKRHGELVAAEEARIKEEQRKATEKKNIEEFESLSKETVYEGGAQFRLETYQRLRKGITDKHALAKVDAAIRKIKPRAEREEREAAKRRAEEQRIASILGRKPENSSWDGAVPEVVKFLKANLNDYKSVEYVEWSPVEQIPELPGAGGPYWGVRCKFRAANAFGGKILNNWLFLIQQGRVVTYVDFDQ